MNKTHCVWDSFGSGPAYPKGLTSLFVGDCDVSSSQLCYAGSADFPRQFFGESWT
jgi:hypothetical protein